MATPLDSGDIPSMAEIAAGDRKPEMIEALESIRAQADVPDSVQAGAFIALLMRTGTAGATQESGAGLDPTFKARLREVTEKGLGIAMENNRPTAMREWLTFIDWAGIDSAMASSVRESLDNLEQKISTAVAEAATATIH